MKIYDITIGEIANECKKRKRWSECIECKFHEFCNDLELKTFFYGIFEHMENMEVNDEH